MAQVLKKEVKENLIQTARQEFLTQGFIKASMRTISKKSGCSLSNIYNYFDNKDKLFEQVISPTLYKLEDFKKSLKKAEPNYLKFDKAEAYFDKIVDFLDENKQNLQLLAFKSKGSKFENYTEKWVKVYSKFEYTSLRKKAKLHKELFRKLPSEFFINSLCVFFFKAVLELANKDLAKEKLAKQVDEVFSFVYNGWDVYLD